MVSPWQKSLNRKYDKKWRVFKKKYEPSYNHHLYGDVNTNVLDHIKYIKNQDLKYSLFYKPNLSTFLNLIWLSQQQQYRNIYYTWCCFLTRFTTVYYKPYIEYLMQGQIETKLSVFNSQIPLFKFLESYYYTVPHFQTFKSDYFFYDNYDYPYLLSYKDYMFKSGFTAYGVLWIGVERLRQKKYNEYVKSHYILHQSKYKALRARYIVKNVIFPQNKLLSVGVDYKEWHLKAWYKFVLDAKSKRYQIVLNNVQAMSDPYVAPAIYKLDLKNQSLFSYYQTNRNYLNTYIWNSIDISQKLNTPWFRGLVYMPIVININKALVNQLYQFPTQSRLDIIHSSHYILAHGAGPLVYNRLIEKQTLNVKHQIMGEFFLQDSVQDYLITHNLAKCMSKNKLYNEFINKLEYYSFDSQSINLMISNEIFNRYLATRLFSNQVRVSPMRIRHQVHLIDNTYLFEHLSDYILCGNYYKIPNYMFKVMGLMSYFYWRSYNTDGIHQAHKGRLHLYHYIKKLNIQTLLSQQLYHIYKSILHIWAINKISASSVGISQMWNYMVVNYLNWLHEYSYLTFFCLFKTYKMDLGINYYQQLYMNKPYTNFLSHIVVRRYLANYLTIFRYLRRAPYDQARGTCIHGKSPDRLQQWLLHTNWMRIIGLSRDQLPFYLYPDDQSETIVRNWDDFDEEWDMDRIRQERITQKKLKEEKLEKERLRLEKAAKEHIDYLPELIKKTSHHQVNIYSCDLFVIDNQTTNGKFIKFKPYIKNTNMLYDK